MHAPARKQRGQGPSADSIAKAGALGLLGYVIFRLLDLLEQLMRKAYDLGMLDLDP